MAVSLTSFALLTWAHLMVPSRRKALNAFTETEWNVSKQVWLRNTQEVNYLWFQGYKPQDYVLM